MNKRKLERKNRLLIFAGSIALSATFLAAFASLSTIEALAQAGINTETHANGLENPDLRPPIMPATEERIPIIPSDLRRVLPQKPKVLPDYNKNEREPGPSMSTEELVQDRMRSFDPLATSGTADTLGKKSQTEPLQGQALATSLYSRAELLANSPLSRYKGEKLLFVHVEIKNSGTEPVLVLGSNARTELPEKESEVVDIKTLENHDNRLLSTKERIAVGAVSVGSLGLASSIFNEMMTPSENRKRDLGLALGRDRGRHEVEGERLGLRLIMPGDNTSGWVAIHDNEIERTKNRIFVPVMFSPYTKVNAVLEIPVNLAR